jgi:hypothetical protein
VVDIDDVRKLRSTHDLSVANINDVLMPGRAIHTAHGWANAFAGSIAGMYKCSSGLLWLLTHLSTGCKVTSGGAVHSKSRGTASDGKAQNGCPRAVQAVRRG